MANGSSDSGVSVDDLLGTVASVDDEDNKGADDKLLGGLGCELKYDRTDNGDALNDAESDSVPVKAETPLQDTAGPASSDDTPKDNLDPSEQTMDDDDDDDRSEESSGSSEEEDDDDDSTDLLQRAQDRIARQHLLDEVEALKAVIERKNTELESLAGQLRRAEATKSDLLLVNNEFEKTHEESIRLLDDNLKQMKQESISLRETHSIKEKEMLNELIRLTDLCKDLQTKHRGDMEDLDRMNRNEILEKDFEIAKLTEELRKASFKIEAAPSEQPVPTPERKIWSGRR